MSNAGSDVSYNPLVMIEINYLKVKIKVRFVRDSDLPK